MSSSSSASMYGSPLIPSFSQSPAVGSPDPHLASAHGEVANVSGVASDVLTQVVAESLDQISDPSASAEVKERARRRVLAAVSVVQSAAEATSAFAAAEQALADQLATPAAGWAQAKEGDEVSPADRFALAARDHFDRAREKIAAAAEGMEDEPALAGVLTRRGQEGGVGGFFRRVAAATVSLAALGQRAFALPGLVRQAFSRGLDRADLAVQDAFDRWHGQVGQKVDDLRQAARDKVQEATGAVRDRATAISSAVSGKVGEISDNIRHTADVISQTAAGVVHDVKEDVRCTVSQVKGAAQGTADGIMAFDRVASSRLRSFWNETVAPAFQRFSQELTDEFHSQRSSRSRINAEYAQREGNSAEAPAFAASTTPKMN